MAQHELKNASKVYWHATVKQEGEYPGDENVKIGCLQRIANATEAMAANYVYLQKDRDLYKRWYEQEKTAKEKLQRSNNALRGHINRMKKKNHHP